MICPILIKTGHGGEGGEVKHLDRSPSLFNVLGLVNDFKINKKIKSNLYLFPLKRLIAFPIPNSESRISVFKFVLKSALKGSK